jgi:hypothetical protein
MSEPTERAVTLTTERYRRETGRLIAALRHDGLRWREIAARTDLTIHTCRALMLCYASDWEPPRWPRTVTRIAPSGHWWIVREGER